MSDIIKLLPDSVANQIAAGEVIQRPASVIKELVENSIDANATSITIILKEGGRTLIQVIDDGDGMSDTDARLAFERHSTSKIRNAADLYSLHTMGFRGEALASIAAVSQLELRTSKRGSDMGTHICISASKCESQEPDACPQGCNFMIKNLFFNMPARRKFLKQPKIEMANIVKEFERLALVNPSVEFTMYSNDNMLYKLVHGNIKQRIQSLFGPKMEEQLIPISIDTSLVKIEGFIGKPENARKRNFIQYFFVNGRYMRHPYFHKAVLSSYEQLIPDTTQPNYFLYLTVEPETIDVNIHPTKTEIKFENEIPIWQILSAAVKESLGRFSAVPSIDFDTDDAPEIPAFTGDHEDSAPTSPNIDIDMSYNPFDVGASRADMQLPKKEKSKDFPSTRLNRFKASPSVDWEKLYENFEYSRQKGFEEMPEEEPDEQEKEYVSKLDGAGVGGNLADDADMPRLGNFDCTTSCMQLKGRYILSPVKSGLLIVDQHRAHVKILSEKYLRNMVTSTAASQRVMFPDVLHLSQSQHMVLEEIMGELESVGFDVACLGGTDWSITGTPVGVENVDVKDLLMQVIESVTEGGKSWSSRINEHIALVVAEKAAVPYGRQLSQEEMDKLLSDLLQLDTPNYTPDGKVVMSIMTMEQITKMF